MLTGVTRALMLLWAVTFRVVLLLRYHTHGVQSIIIISKNEPRNNFKTLARRTAERRIMILLYEIIRLSGHCSEACPAVSRQPGHRLIALAWRQSLAVYPERCATCPESHCEECTRR